MRRRTRTATHAALVRSGIEYLERIGAKPVNIATGLFKSFDGRRVVQGSPKGTLDIIACLPARCRKCGEPHGQFGAFDAKIPPDTLNVGQTKFAETVIALGGRAGEFRDLNELLEIIK